MIPELGRNDEPAFLLLEVIFTRACRCGKRDVTWGLIQSGVQPRMRTVPGVPKQGPELGWFTWAATLGT